MLIDIDKITYDVGDKSACVAFVDKDIVIADILPEVNGVPITQINQAAFCGCEQLQKVTIPNSVTKIGEFAFYGLRVVIHSHQLQSLTR